MNTRVLITMLGLLSFSGCRKEQWDDCFTGTGEIVMDERATSGFTAIDLADRFDLVIVPDTVDRVIIEAGRRLLEQISTEVNGTALVIRDDNTCHWVRRFNAPLRAIVHMRELRELVCRGTGDVSCEGTILAPTFNLQVWGAAGRIALRLDAGTCVVGANTGAADLVLEGAAQELQLYSGAHGIIEARGLLAGVCYLNNSGSNDLFVRASGSIGAVLTSAGDVYYTGDAVIAWSNITGAGQLIHLD